MTTLRVTETRYKYETKLIRWPLAANADNWQETAFKWVVSINGIQFDFFTGIGHAKWNLRALWQRYGVKDVTRILDVEKWAQYGKPTPPSLDDVLYSLVSDASACDESFDDWCSNYGYETDSRKALETYLQCQESATKLRKAGVNIEAERERLADY